MSGTIDLFRPYVNPRAIESLSTVLTPGRDGRLFIGQGPLVDRFEEEFAAFIGADADSCVSTSSCTSALGIALKLAGVEHGKGHEVIATPLTCTATNGAIVNAGARIVWADIDRATGNIDLDDVARKATARTKAIVGVNWGGRAGDLPYTDVPCIIDAAHGPFLSTSADYTCYSFGPIKHLTCGDGGMLVTHRGDTERARLLRWHGLSRKTSADFRCGQQQITEPGTKAHLTDLNACIGLANLPDLPWILAKHREHAMWYQDKLAGIPGITLPPFDPTCAYWCFFILVEDRDGFTAHMKARDIQVSPVHARNDTHPAYHFPNGPLPGVDHYSARHVALPVGWHLNSVDLGRVVEAVREWADGVG